MAFTSYSSLSNWDGDEGLFQPKSTLTSKTSSTRDSPQTVPQNESTSECTSLEVAASKQLLVHQGVSSSEPLSALEKCAEIPNLDAIDNETESVDTDTETAVATNMSERINSSLFTPPRRESISPLSPSSPLDGASLFSPRESPKSSTSTLSPLRQQTENYHKKKPGEKFDPESYHGYGTGTLIFLSHIQAPLLPRETTHAHYLKPHPKVLEKITKFSSPSVLFQDSPSPPPFGSHPKKAPPRPNVSAPSVSALPSSSSKQHTQMKYTNLQDALNASTVHNAEDDYIGAFIDKSRHVVRRKQKQSPFDGVYLPRKKAKLNPSTVAAPSAGNSSVSVVVSQKPTTTKISYIPGDIMVSDKTREDGDGYVRLFVGRDVDFISGAGWMKNAHESTIPNSSSKQKKRDHRMLLVKNSNTRHIGAKNHGQVEVQNLGTKRGLPPGLNSCSAGLINWKGKDRMSSFSKRNSGWVERMFASIFAPETVAGYRIVQNSDEEFPGDETDDEDDLPYLDLSEVHKLRASSSYPSANTGKSAMPLTNPNPKPKTQPHGSPQRALSSFFGGPPKSSSPKNIKFRKKPSSSTTPNAVAQYVDSGSSYESLSTSSGSYLSVSVPTSFSLPISTQSWSSSSLSAQSLRKSYSQPECHSLPAKGQQFSIQPDAKLLNPPGLSNKALGKRKAFDDGVKPHVKRGRPAKPRPSTVLANSSMSQYHGHVSHTHHDAYHAQNLYEARGNHLILDSVGQHELFSRTSAVSASGPSTILGAPQITDHLVKIPSSEGNQDGHIYRFSPHAHVQTSTQTNAHIPGSTFPTPIASVGNPFFGDGAESGVETEALIGQKGHDEPDTHCDDLKWAAEKILVLPQNDPQQVKDVIEMLQLQRPTQTANTGNTLPQPRSHRSFDGFLNMRHDVEIGQASRKFSVQGDHREVDVGEWLVPSLGIRRIPEAGDQVNSEIEPGLYPGPSRSSRAATEITTPDHPAVQFGQHKHTSVPPDADSNATINPSILFSVEDEHVLSDGLAMLDSSERVYYSGDPLPPRGKKRMISVQPKAQKRRNTDIRSSATSPVPQPPPPLLQSNALSLVLDYASNSDSEEKDDLHEDSLDFDVHFHTSVSALSATPATLASPSTVSSSLQESKATINDGVDVISIGSGSGLQTGSERSLTSRLTIHSPNLRLSDLAALEIPRPANLSQKAKGREKEKKKKQVPVNRRNWPLGSSEYFCHQCRRRSSRLHMACAFDDCNLKYCMRCITFRYADLLVFDPDRKDFSCFRCTNNCRCDACCRKRGDIYIPLRTKQVQPASGNESAELMAVTQRRQRRKNANRKQMDLELKTKEIEDGAPSESAGPSGENTIAGRRERRDKAKGKAKQELETITSSEMDTECEKETVEGAALTKSSWPEGSLEYYCHQCRSKSFRLYMECASEGCNAKYCIRCVTSRYANIISFDSTRDDFVCFRCKDTCICDICCRKRGETYISFRRPPARPTTFKPAHLRSRQSEERPYPKLAPITVDTQVSHPVVYWGAVYNWTGEVIASAYVASVENDGVIFARPLQKRRVFIGDVQPDWELGSNSRIRYLGESRENVDHDTSLGPLPTTRKRKIFYVGQPPPPSTVISASPSGPIASSMGNSAAYLVDVDEVESQAESMSIDDIADQSVIANGLGASFSETRDTEREEVLASGNLRTFMGVRPFSHSSERDAYKSHSTHNLEGRFRSPETKRMKIDVNGDMDVQPSSAVAEGEIDKPLSACDFEAPFDNPADVQGMYDVYGDSRTDMVIQISATADEDEGEAAIGTDLESGAVTMNCGETKVESLDPQMDYDTTENFHVPYDNISPTSATEFDITVLVEDDMFLTKHLPELSVVQDHASHSDSHSDALVNDEAISEDQEYSTHNSSITTDTHPNFETPFENYEFPLDIGSPLTDLDDDD